jgi:hypothetical protein
MIRSASLACVSIAILIGNGIAGDGPKDDDAGWRLFRGNERRTGEATALPPWTQLLSWQPRCWRTKRRGVTSGNRRVKGTHIGV